MNKYALLVLLIISTFQQVYAFEKERDDQVCMDCNYNFKVDHGYCSKTKSCVPARGGLEACGGWEDWHNSKSSCVSCSEFTDCGSCAEDGFCAWLEGRCVNDSQAKGIKERISYSSGCDSKEAGNDTEETKPTLSTNASDKENEKDEIIRDPSIADSVYERNAEQCGDSRSCYACIACNERDGSFDFNLKSNTCVSRAHSTENWEEWQNSLSSCVPMDKVDNCYECARDGFGAWYHNKCINDSQSGKLKGKITDFNKCPPSKRL